MNNPAKAKSNLRGIGYLTLGAGSFVLNDSLMKMILDSLPPFEVLSLRGVFGLISLFPMLAYAGQLSALPAAVNRWVALRGLMEVGAVLCFIPALAHAPQADVTAIFQIMPMLILLGLAVFYREALDGRRWILIGLGFAGALMVAQPGRENASPFALLAFLTAFFAAARDLIGRRIPSATPAMVSTLVTVLLVLAASTLAGILAEEWLIPTGKQVVLMVAAGALMSIGHVLTFLAYKHADTQAVAPFYYSFMVWALILGYFLFDSIPNMLALSGMALILISGVAVVMLEGRSKPGLP